MMGADVSLSHQDSNLDRMHYLDPIRSRALVALVVLLASGCASYTDPQIGRTPVAGALLDTETSYFCQHAGQVTRDGADAGESLLSRSLGFWDGRTTVLVRFRKLSDGEFSVEYLDRDLNVSGSRHYIRGQDYRLRRDGVVEIKLSSRCGGGGPGLGCSRKKARLFIDASGHLVVQQTLSGGGLVGIVPVGVRARYQSIFPALSHTGRSLPDALDQCPEPGSQSPRQR